MHFIISGNIRKEIRNIMSFTELKKLHWLLSNGHFSVISERALVHSYWLCPQLLKLLWSMYKYSMPFFSPNFTRLNRDILSLINIVFFIFFKLGKDKRDAESKKGRGRDRLGTKKITEIDRCTYKQLKNKHVSNCILKKGNLDGLSSIVNKLNYVARLDKAKLQLLSVVQNCSILKNICMVFSKRKCSTANAPPCPNISETVLLHGSQYLLQLRL